MCFHIFFFIIFLYCLLDISFRKKDLGSWSGDDGCLWWFIMMVSIFSYCIIPTVDVVWSSSHWFFLWILAASQYFSVFMSIYEYLWVFMSTGRFSVFLSIYEYWPLLSISEYLWVLAASQYLWVFMSIYEYLFMSTGHPNPAHAPFLRFRWEPCWKFIKNSAKCMKREMSGILRNEWNME